MHVCDGQTDRRTDRRTEFSSLDLVCIASSAVKIIERVVKSRLTEHLTSNNLLTPHQSSYIKHHSTETDLLYIHDHLINAIGSQKYSKTVEDYSTVSCSSQV